MKIIIKYIVDFFKHENNILFYILAILLTSIVTFIEYYFHFSASYIDPLEGKPLMFLYSYLLYGVVFLGTIFLYVFMSKKQELLQNKSFLFLIFFIVAVFSFRCYFVEYRTWAKILSLKYDPVNKYYWRNCANQIFQGLLLFIPLAIYGWVHKKNNENFYGWKRTNQRPYFYMLLVMIPLVMIASTQSDFLHTYPLYKYSIKNSASAYWLRVFFFEMCYAFDFVMNEFFFRGFIILALMKYLGRGAIIPMACLYVTIHFGKPLGETISSFFGGAILGIVVYYSRSIYGGIIVHLGIAWLMEIGGTLGHLFLDKN